MHRFAEIDLVRGLAVAGMIVFHFLFDLDFLGILPLELESGFWFVFARATASIFVFLAGVSCVLFAQRRGDAHALHVRGAKIFAGGLLITLVSYATFPEYAIWFGALHLIGFGIFASPFFVHRPALAAVMGVAILGLGVLFSVGFIPFLPSVPGVFPMAFPTFDYFPLFPWLGVFLLGVAFAIRAYSPTTPHSRLGWKTIPPFLAPFNWAGRHSLLIYFVHQPILLGILWGLRLI
jgi:uncharacterized membrane protein